MVAIGGPVAVNTLLALLIATGVVVPILTAVRLFIILRGARLRKDRVGGGLTATYVGEGFLVAVAIFNTVESILWVWNCMEELSTDGTGVTAIDKLYLQVFDHSLFFPTLSFSLGELYTEYVVN
jgi:hypothetical protein